MVVVKVVTAVVAAVLMVDLVEERTIQVV